MNEQEVNDLIIASIVGPVIGIVLATLVGLFAIPWIIKVIN